MATTPPITSTGEPPPAPVQVKEDPASLELRARLVAAEEKQATTIEAMGVTNKALVAALSAPPAAVAPGDAQLWNGYFHEAMRGLLRHPQFKSPVLDASNMADAMLTEHRKRYPVVPAAAKG